MTVVSDILRILERVKAEKWFNVEGTENHHRCLFLISLADAIEVVCGFHKENGAEADAEPLSTEGQLQAAIDRFKSYARQSAQVDTAKARKLLLVLIGMKFTGIITDSTLGKLEPALLKGLVVQDDEPIPIPVPEIEALRKLTDHLYKGSVSAFLVRWNNGTTSFEPVIRKIALGLKSLITRDLVPVTAAAVPEDLLEFLKMKFVFEWPGSVADRVALLGFNLDHPLHETWASLVEQSRKPAEDLDVSESAEVSGNVIAVLESFLENFCVGGNLEFPDNFEESFQKLTKVDAETCLRKAKEKLLLISEESADPKTTNAVVGVLTSMVIAGYSKAWDTALRDHKFISGKEWGRYDLLVVMALSSVRDDEVAIIKAYNNLFLYGPEDNGLTIEKVLTIFDALLFKRKLDLLADPALSLTYCLVVSTLSLASLAAKNPGDSFVDRETSTSSQRLALCNMSELCLLAAQYDFSQNAEPTALFNALMDAAKYYKALFFIHTGLSASPRDLAAADRKFGEGQEYFTEKMRAAIMSSGEHVKLDCSCRLLDVRARLSEVLALEIPGLRPGFSYPRRLCPGAEDYSFQLKMGLQLLDESEGFLALAPPAFLAPKAILPPGQFFPEANESVKDPSPREAFEKQFDPADVEALKRQLAGSSLALVKR